MEKKISQRERNNLICERLNKCLAALGKPAGYFISYAYGQPRLEQDTPQGGKDISPRLPAKELERWMFAFLDGIDAATK